MNKDGMTKEELFARLDRIEEQMRELREILTKDLAARTVYTVSAKPDGRSHPRREEDERYWEEYKRNKWNGPPGSPM